MCRKPIKHRSMPLESPVRKSVVCSIMKFQEKIIMVSQNIQCYKDLRHRVNTVVNRCIVLRLTSKFVNLKKCCSQRRVSLLWVSEFRYLPRNNAAAVM